MQSKSYIELIVSPVSFQLVFNMRNVTVHETLYMILDKHATTTKYKSSILYECNQYNGCYLDNVSHVNFLVLNMKKLRSIFNAH